jgi:hypothetical protein
MDAATASIDELRLHYATQESALIYGGSVQQKNPLEQLIDRELDDEYGQRDQRSAEILLRLLTFAADGAAIEGVTCNWRRINPKIPDGHTIHYSKVDAANGVYLPSVEIRDHTGKPTQRWEPAKLKSIYKPRKGRKALSAEIKVLTITPESAAIRVGTRMISLAALAGVISLREMTGAGIAKKLLVTRQAVSLTNKAMESKIKEATGGKSGARGLRHKADPRKGKTIAEIQGREG